MTGLHTSTVYHKKFDIETDGTPIVFIEQTTGDRHPIEEVAPYTVGQAIYVRETWGIAQPTRGTPGGTNYDAYYLYKADNPDFYEINREHELFEFKWRSPATMPRAASRLTIVPTEVKAVQLKDLTEDDLNNLLGLEEDIWFTAFWFKADWIKKYGTYSPDTWVWYVKIRKENEG